MPRRASAARTCPGGHAGTWPRRARMRRRRGGEGDSSQRAPQSDLADQALSVDEARKVEEVEGEHGAFELGVQVGEEANPLVPPRGSEAAERVDERRQLA